ncbi:MAG: hypothetical protein ACRC7W_05285 [Fusobacteriaceae bacterium]
MYIIYAKYNEENPYIQYIGASNNENTASVLDVMQSTLFLDKIVSCDFKENYQNVDIDDYGIYNMDRCDYLEINNRENVDIDNASMYRVYYTLNCNCENYDKVLGKDILSFQNNSKLVELKCIEFIKKLPTYKKLSSNGEVKITISVKEIELKNLDNKFKGIIKIL